MVESVMPTAKPTEVGLPFQREETTFKLPKASDVKVNRIRQCWPVGEGGGGGGGGESPH